MRRQVAGTIDGLSHLVDQQAVLADSVTVAPSGAVDVGTRPQPMHDWGLGRAAEPAAGYGEIGVG
jgi:hypothetical protein